jgi:hypothetical protein
MLKIVNFYQYNFLEYFINISLNNILLKPVKILWAEVKCISKYAATDYSICMGGVFCRLMHLDLGADLLVLLAL